MIWKSSDCVETIFWHEMLVEAEFLKKEMVSETAQEADEILKVMSSFKKRLEPKN